jgi:MFS family permease
MFGYSLVNWSIGNGLLPILPKIAATLGADKFLTGIYLAVSYVALAGGTLAAGYLADRFGHRKGLMISAGLAAAPLIFLVSKATTLWELTALTASTWCIAGMALTLVTIQAGLSAGPRQRGSVLGFLALSAPVGSIAGGLGVGALADALGYTTMWTILALVFLLSPVLALFVRETPTRSRMGSAGAPPSHLRWTAPFFLLILCGTLGAIGTFVGGLGRSFAMQDTFSNEAITSTVAVSGLVALPFTFLMGWMSDRRGRLPFMGLCYAAGVLGLLVYSMASSLGQFWIAASLLAFISYVSTGIGSALVVDLVDKPSLGRGLAYFGATGWIGAILAFAGGSLAFSAFGLAAGFLLGAALTTVAIGLLGVMHLVSRPLRHPAGGRR